MAEIRSKLIVELPVAQIYNGTEIFPIQQDGVTRKTTSEDIIDYTKKQDYATWVYKASSNLLTKSLTSGYITMIVDPSNDKDKPEFFIGESSFTQNLELTGLSGFKFFYDEIKDNFIFTRSISSVSSIRVLTAYYIDQNAITYINNLSTANVLSAKDIFSTNNITISTNNTTQGLYIVQKGSGYALKIEDESSDGSPFVIDNAGNVSIKTDKVRADLTISGNTSASGSLSASKVFVWDNVAIATNSPNEKLTVNGNISSNNVIYDQKGNSLNWNSNYTDWNSVSAFSLRARTFVGNNSANILQVNTKVNNTSADWDSVYSNWNTVSAFDNRVRTFVGLNSSNQLSVYSHYNTNSATFATRTYVQENFLALSGGTVGSITDTGFLNVSGNGEFAGDVIIRGKLSAFSVVQISPTIVAQSANSLTIDTSATIGQKLVVNGESFLNSLYVTTNAVVTGSITSNTFVTAPIIYGGSGNSNNWNTTYNEWLTNRNILQAGTTFTGNNSANQLSVYSTVRTNSADWESVYSDWNSVSAFDNRVRTFVGLNSAAIIAGTSTWNNVSSFYLEARTFTGNNSANDLSIFSTVRTNSADWESVYSNWNSVSAFDNRVRTFVGLNSSNWESSYSFTNLNSASWGTGGTHGSVYSRNSGTYLTNLSGDARYVRLNNFPSLAYVPLSGGTMSGSLTVNNPIYVSYAGRTSNSTDWDDAADYFSLSGNRVSNAVTWLYSNSGDIIPTEVRRLSSTWNSVYSTYNANSAVSRGTVTLATNQTVVNVPNYKVGSMDVFLNGVKLVNGVDFTATTGSTIVLLEPAKNNDYVLDYVSYSSFTVPNAVLKTGDTMSGTLTVPQLVVTNQAVQANVTGNTTGIHTGNVVNGNLDGTILNYVRTGALSSFNLNVSGGTFIYAPATSTKDAVQIINSGSGNSLYVSDGGIGDITPTIIDNTGRIINGYVSAANISGTTAYDYLQVKNGASVMVNATYANNATGPEIRFVKSRGAAIEQNSMVANNDLLGGIQYYGANGSNTALESARIAVTVDGNPSFQGSVPSRIDVFTTSGGGGNMNNRVTIRNNGNVGIGTNNPSEKIHIVDGNVRVQSGSLAVSGSISGNVFYGDGSGLTNIDGDKAFLRFTEEDNYVGAGSLFRTTAFISKTNKLWLAGYCDGGTRLGLGDVNYADEGYHQVVAVNLLAGEYIVKHYFQRYSQYFLTNLGNIYATGRNDYGQLGLGDTTNRNVFQRITGITNVTHFSCENGNDGAAFCTAVSNGKLYAWGYNGQFRFGTNDNVQRNSPQLITLGSIATKTIVKAYAIGDTYTSYGFIAAIDSNKNIHFCGVNGAGQFGIATGDRTSRTTFVQHPTMLADEYYAGMYNSYAVSFILYNGKLFTAGGYDTATQYGQLGNNGTTARTTFAEVVIPGKTFRSIAVCDYYGGSVAAIMDDGTLWTWGRNNQGQLGNGTVNNAVTPGYTGLTNIVKVLGVDNNYCFFAALNSSGELYVSGYNGYGQKGIGTTAQNNNFSKVIKPEDLKFVDFTCWGWNSGTGWTAADQYGDLWSCGYGGQWTTARRHVNNSYPYVVTRCNVNV